MKKVFLILVIVWFISGCSIKPATGNTLPSEDEAKEITVEVRDMWHFYEEAAKAFKKETGIKVNVVNDYDENETNDQMENNLNRIITELMAGKGADIYINDLLDFMEFGEKNHLFDMAEWIDKDTEIKNDAYYMAIINSGTNNGKIYALPLFFITRTLSAPVRVPELEGQDNLTWEQFFEKTKNIKHSGVLLGLYDFEIFHKRIRDRMADLLDKENNKINMQDMVELLKQCKNWSKQGLCIKYTNQDAQIVNDAFFHEYTSGLSAIMNISPDPKMYYYSVLSDTKNNIGNKIWANNFVCINSASKCKTTAWKFIKYLLSEKIQSSAKNYSMPVNRKAADKKMDEEFSYMKGDGINFDLVKAKKDTKALLDSVKKVPIFMHFSACYKILFLEARRYYSDEITAEEAAKNMKSKVELYLKEQI